jgi:hypothetical protein
MNIKLEFLLPNLQSAQQIRKALLMASIEDKNIHFLANEDVKLGDLIPTTAFEGGNVMHEGERGLTYGMGLGLLAGLYVVFFPHWITLSPSWYTDASWYVVLAICILAGSIFFGLGAAILGANIYNTDLNQYKSRIVLGEILAIISTPIHKANKIRQLVHIELNRL